MIFKSIKTGGIPRVLIAILGGPGVCRPVLQVLTLFQTKKCHFPHRFKTWPVRNYVTITDKKTNPKKVSQTPFWICIRSYTPVVLSKTIPESRPNRAKVYTRFQTKTVQKPYPLGRHILPPGVAWSMYVYRQPRALQSTGQIEIFSYVSLQISCNWNKRVLQMSIIVANCECCRSGFQGLICLRF